MENCTFLAFFSERRLNSPVAVPVIFQSIFVQMTSIFLRFVKIDCFTFCFMEYALRQIGRVLHFSKKIVQSRQSIFHDIINILLI